MMKKGAEESKKEEETQVYNAERVVGNGSFGVVYQASIPGKNESVAIKKVYQDKRYKNRELQIMKELNHPCVIKMRHAFYTKGTKQDQLYLNVVMDYIPQTVYRVMKHYNKQKQYVPNLLIKLYAYQMCRALAYIHALGITHRDIKPQNLLIDPTNHSLKLCDFGSAKKLVRGEPSVSYICSRYYRAPELIFGATDYSHPIDVWSMGCVIAELMLGQPLFPGDSGVDQLVEIIKVLGTPTKEQIKSMNPNYTEFKFPQIRAHPWNKVFRSKTSPEAIDLVSKFLIYDPEKRIKPMDALLHSFFQQLREPETKLPNGNSLPDLFCFTDEEKQSTSKAVMEKLVPAWYRERQHLKEESLY